MAVRTGEDQAGAGRESMPLIIAAHLGRLHEMIGYLETDLEEFVGQVSPKKEPTKGISTPSFQMVYSTLPDALKQFTDRLGEFRNKLRAMLL